MSHVTCRMSHVTCHKSHVTCHVSHVTCHMSFFWTNWWILWVEGLLSTGPTPSSFQVFDLKDLNSHLIFVQGCPTVSLCFYSQNSLKFHKICFMPFLTILQIKNRPTRHPKCQRRKQKKIRDNSLKMWSQKSKRSTSFVARIRQRLWIFFFVFFWFFLK